MPQSRLLLASIAALSLLAAFPPVALGQPGVGVVSGRVTDPSGRTIPDATVTLLKGGTVVKTAKTDVAGQYRLTTVTPGTYSVQVTARGFGRYRLASYEVTPGVAPPLDVAMVIATDTQAITVADDLQVATDPASSAGAVALRGKDLDALSDDPTDLAVDLQALAGPAAGPNGGQLYIDGFTGGRLPAKQSIREVRINQNPFAAQFDRPGQGRIEIFTKPGADELHGQLVFQFSDDLFNSRNPFVTDKPPYQRRQVEGEITGPINKKTSFLLDFETRNTKENAFLNGVKLNGNFNPVPFSGAIVTPVTGIESNFRIDRQLTKNHTLTARYGANRDSNHNQGIGGFSLPSRAYKVRDHEDTLQVSETGVLNLHTANETRFRYRRQRTKDTGATSDPTVTVLDSFTAGGAPLSLSFNHQDRYELQNITSLIHHKHTIRWGGLLRAVSLTDQSTQNYPGTFTFTSLESYRITQIGLKNGNSPVQIRVAGGGASQFSIAGGDPLAKVKQFDFGLFLQDDWKVSPKLTLSGGLRYEAQTHSGDYTNFAPRIAVAWAPGKASTKTPKTVIRAGFGIFYDRLGESLTLDATRLDGVHQQQFLIPAPDFYPTVPSIPTLSGALQPQALRRTDVQWVAPRMYQASIGFERQLAKNLTIATNYLHSRGVHAARSRNINAPYPGLAVRPYGGINSIYLYETSGLYRQNQLITNVNARISPKLTLTAFYALGYADSNTDGAGSFPSNQYDLTTEYGRAGFDIRHRVQFNGTVALPLGVRLNPFLTITSGRPYNITVGKDLNGDSLFNDRPAIATDLNRLSVVRTPLRIFDLAPLPGQAILARNYADGPGSVMANMRVSKTLTLGESAGGKPASDPKQLVFSVNARNLLNHPNFASPSGNLSSTLFGYSTAITGGGQGGVRRIDLQVRFDF